MRQGKTLINKWRFLYKLKIYITIHFIRKEVALVYLDSISN